MFQRVKVVDVELASPLNDFDGLDGYAAVKCLVRVHGAPIDYVRIPVINGRCPASAIATRIMDELGDAVMRRLLHHRLARPLPKEPLSLQDLVTAPPPEPPASAPLVTVAVCSRDRPRHLRACLAALSRLEYPALDLLLVDNAPISAVTEQLVRTEFPHIRYVCEPRPGLDWARNRAIIEAQGDIIAYTDDDVLVDAGWVSALAQVFAAHDDVMAVTGLVVPAELETESQALFELYGGFGKGFERRWYRLDRKRPWSRLDLDRTNHIGAGQFGTGANMAYRRTVFDEIGCFDPALDVGTVTNGGGDLEMFFRILQEGHTLVYEPRAIVRHSHRRDYAGLRTQLTNNGMGFFSYLVGSYLAYPDQRWPIIRFTCRWMLVWHMQRLLKSFIWPSQFPRDLIVAEILGSFVGLDRYQKARQTAVEVAQMVGSGASRATPEAAGGLHGAADNVEVRRGKRKLHSTRIERTGPNRFGAAAVRLVDLTMPLRAVDGVQGYDSTWIAVLVGDRLLGRVEIRNHHQPISTARLRDLVVKEVGDKILEALLLPSYRPAFAAHLGVVHAGTKPRLSLPNDISVSIVVATLDRPETLRACLQSLLAQDSPRPVEIVVVDNNPASGLTPPTVADFPTVVLVSEQRRGLAYARNRGINVSTGAIVITIDDDVAVARDWLERLIAPFARPDVMVVTGNVLPLELDTEAQQLFEAYGGLGRGFDKLDVDNEWFNRGLSAVPTWRLGATANAAFRATIFRHPDIGLLDEALGPGTPSGVGEDTYLFYRVLKAGFTIVYEPSAYVWHRHRRDMAALRRQLYSYSKGHVAYHLTTLLRDHDLRALVYLLIRLPQAHVRRIKERIHKRSVYPLSLILLEIGGNLAGPWSLCRSRLRVRRLGRSNPCFGVPANFLPVR